MSYFDKEQLKKLSQGVLDKVAAKEYLTSNEIDVATEEEVQDVIDEILLNFEGSSSGGSGGNNVLATKQDVMQYSTMPTASAEYLGKIFQYIGTTNTTYTNGYFYECTENSGTYSWTAKNVQESSGGGSLTFDSTPTSGSSNPVTSGGVYAALQNVGGVGENVSGQSFTVNNSSVTAGNGAERFNIYTDSYNIATGEYSHAEGCNTTASERGSHAEGFATKASGYASHAEGVSTTASGYASHAEGDYTTASAYYSHSQGMCTLASNYASHACGKYNKAMTDGGSMSNTVGDAFVIGNGKNGNSGLRGDATLSNAFRVTFAGAVYGLSAFNSSGADYAEYFEWKDGNPDDEDRVGYFVTMDGEQITKAKKGDYILGVVSGQPCIIGNSDEDWLGRWEHDEYGRFITEDVDTPVLDADGNETGEVTHGWKYKANPDYDSTQEYIERKDRQEWSAVGMLGVLSVRDDGTCTVNGYAAVTDDGIATKAAKCTAKTYRVIKRVTDNVVKIIFR